MAQVSQATLRLDILCEARNRYVTARNMRHVTAAEASLCSLKIAECEAMIAEIAEIAAEAP